MAPKMRSIAPTWSQRRCAARSCNKPLRYWGRSFANTCCNCRAATRCSRHCHSRNGVTRQRCNLLAGNASRLPALLVGHRHREGHDIAHAAGFADFRRTQALDFIYAHYRVHRHKAAHHAVKLSLELLFARIDHQLAALAENEFLDFHEAPQIALKDLLGIHFVHLALVKENHLVDRFTLAHGKPTTPADRGSSSIAQASDAER